MTLIDLPPGALGDVARALAGGLGPWDPPLATVAGDGRAYELLVSTGELDAWRIHWPAGSGLDAHDHGGSRGAFVVVSGALVEHAVTGDGWTTRRLAAGEDVVFDGEHVHAVTNDGDVAAVSVHVYSPPLRSMGFYAAGAGGSLRRQRVDDVGAARR